MPLDSNIALQYKPFQVEPQTNALARILQLQNAQQQNALGGLQLQEQQNTINERNALRDYLGNTANNIDTPEGQAGLYKAAPTQAAGILKGRLDLKSTQSTIDLNAAKAAEAAFKTMHDKATAMSDLISTATDQASYDAAKARGQAMGLTIDPNAPAQYDPKYVASQLAQAQTAKDRIEQQAKQRGLDLTQRGQDMTAATAKAGQAVQMRGQDIGAATSTANTAATNETHLKVAGLNPDGSATGDTQAMVDAIGQYKVAPPNGMALRNPRMQSILAQVAEKYPDFDATQYGARQQAAKAFSTGKDAQAVQSANTALNHLDTIEQLAMAQKNGGLPLFNKVANAYAAQTGQPAPTNLKAAISMVAPELTKAVVGTGGGVGERADFAHNLNPNGSPEQILQGVGVIKDLMGGRLTEVQRTYERTTGRKDFGDSFLSDAAKNVLSARGGGAAAHPAAITSLLNKYK